VSSDLSHAAATPLVVLPGMTDAEIAAEWDLMVERSKALDDFLYGSMTFSEYSEILDRDGIEIEGYLDNWEESLDLIYAYS
jgi:hypothetical protein